MTLANPQSQPVPPELLTDMGRRVRAELGARYDITRVLGEGGMATVYLATDPRYDRQVAIKVLHPGLAGVIGDGRFLTEIRTTAQLQHQHILPLYDSGETASFLYYVMPYLEAASLRQWLDRDGCLSVEHAVRVAGEIAAGLEYAHGEGVIHRDIKPENVLFQNHRVQLADFGIAVGVIKPVGSRITASGILLGTPDYMSPEQAVGEADITVRSDVFSLGVVTYEMLAGHPPFSGPNPVATIARLLAAEPASMREANPLIPAHIEDAVFTALAKRPADRFPTPSAFARALLSPGRWSRFGGLPGLRRGRARNRSTRQGSGHQRVRLSLVLIAGVGAGWFLGGVCHLPAGAASPAADLATRDQPVPRSWQAVTMP